MKRTWIIQNLGTLTQITCRTKKARKWLDSNVHYESWQEAGNGILVDSRMAEDIVTAIEDNF